MHAVIPLKRFDIAKERLAPALSQQQRSSLAKATADRVTRACIQAGFDIAIVAGGEAVAEWAGRYSAMVIPDPTRGLNLACEAGIAASADPWIVVHGDLPLLDAATMRRVGSSLAQGQSVIAPSRDGGTNLLGSSDRIRLSYGPGSFHRHIAALQGPLKVLTDIETIVELDTPADLSVAAAIPEGAWLTPFLS